MSKFVNKKELNSKVYPEIYDVIKSPIITEKSQEGVKDNKVTFKVAPDANKNNVKKAIEAIFGVSVVKVNIVVLKGKTKLFRGRTGKRNDVKKAIITIAEGQSIDVASKI